MTFPLQKFGFTQTGIEIMLLFTAENGSAIPVNNVRSNTEVVLSAEHDEKISRFVHWGKEKKTLTSCHAMSRSSVCASLCSCPGLRG